MEYVTPTKGTRDVESLLIGRSPDNYSTIDPSLHLTVDFEVGDCAGHLTVGWIKGGKSLTSLETYESMSSLKYFPTRNYLTVEMSLAP
ncbi:hypothetical protein TNCV_115391 [Trichonephila clavipes]|nr:hypothetical protein TNCV_115391 [Trichonephila clavipes]